jgi:hypothetical protein
MRHFKRASMAICLWLLLGGVSVAADRAEVRVTRTDGASDAISGAPQILTVSGESSVPAHIYVKYRAAGAAPCTSNSASDPGAAMNAFYGAVVEGTFAVQEILTFDTPKAVLFCVWISEDAATASVPFAQIVDFRAPVGQLVVTVPSRRPQPERPVVIQVKGSSEVPAYVYATVRQDDGSTCVDGFMGQTDENIAEDIRVYGAFSLRLITVPAKAGEHMVCAWLVRSATVLAPFTGPVAVVLDVRTPKRCLVPAVRRGSRPTGVRQRLRHSHCSIGQTMRAHSSRVRRGLVIRLTRRAGTRLADGTPVGLILSSGPVHDRR